MMRLFDFMCCMWVGVVFLLLFSVMGSYVLNIIVIVVLVVLFDCLEYWVVGICYWFYCIWGGCMVCIFVKVCYYIFDVVVFSYSNMGENLWVEVWVMSMVNLFV